MDKPRIDLDNVLFKDYFLGLLCCLSCKVFIQSLNSVKQVSLSLLNIIKLDILWINLESTAQYTARHLIMKTNVENCLIYCNFRAKSYLKKPKLDT